VTPRGPKINCSCSNAEANPEECYFSFSFSPVHGANGGVDGIFTAVIENTGRVLGERRLRTLRDLGASLTKAKSAKEACRVAANVLADNRADVPFALLYLVDPQSRRGTLVASTGGDSGIPAAPTSFELDDTEGASAWALASVCRSGEPADVGTLSSRALLLPMATAGEPLCTGVIAVGVSPRRELDQEYKGFFELIARRVAAAIAEARAYEAESRRAQALAEIDRAKTAFFSNVSHEFRTPLTLMLGPLEELKGELTRPTASLSAAHYQQIDFAHRNGLRLLKLVNTLLDFSRIEAGRVQAVYEPTDLAGITAELASVFRSAIEKAGLRLMVDCPDLSEHAYVDREMWEKIVLNLVSNAFKFTFEGEIEVKLRQADDHVELTVRDTGTGIPAHELPKLFERFHRVAGAHGRTHEGSGIGLALVQELVKLHGGSVSVDSQYRKGAPSGWWSPLATITCPPGRSVRRATSHRRRWERRPLSRRRCGGCPIKDRRTTRSSRMLPLLSTPRRRPASVPASSLRMTMQTCGTTCAGCSPHATRSTWPRMERRRWLRSRAESRISCWPTS
jgi:signal transduction histidine kinase